MERKFGIAAFDYWWGYTAAQIELMVADQPVISYKNDRKSERSMFGSREEVDEMDALADAWKAMNGDGVAGQTVNLSEFVSGKM